MSAEKQTEQNLLNMALDYLDAPELHLTGDDATQTRSTTGKFKLIDKHLPVLHQGDYEVTVTQTVDGDGITGGNQFTATQTVRIAAPDVQLKPADVFSVFPPIDSTGDHSNYLPHLVLNRSTLPWEKASFNKDKNAAWLALILLDETEFNTSQSVKPGDAITFDTKLIAPDHLSDLCHVIQRMDDSEKSVIICNRLPRAEATSMVHLIALDAETCPDGKIPAGEHAFTSLFNWRFACEKSEKNFEGVLSKLGTGLLKLPATPDNETYNTLFAKGFVPLPHFMRLGTQAVSWYRSPLVPVEKIKGFKFQNINSSDDLLRFDKNTKMLDATYGAAWELGRMMTLREKDVATAIYNYKRQMAQQNKQSNQAIIAELFDNAGENSKLPDDIKAWLNNLLFLKPVPFNYLVPYEAMLPAETLRFFMLDKKWVQCLLDGAMSIGRIFDAKSNTKDKTIEEVALNWSGFIMRSEVIANYPDLDVMAGNNSPVAIRRLASDIIMVLFRNTKINEIDVYLKPEGLHFGFSKVGEELQLTFKNEDGSPSENTVSVETNNGLVNFSTLKSNIESTFNTTITSAGLALQLMALPQKVKFSAKS